MGKCTVCGAEVNRLFGGKCSACLAQGAVDKERHQLDEDNMLPDYEMNSDIQDAELLKIFGTGQGNFGQKDK